MLSRRSIGDRDSVAGSRSRIARALDVSGAMQTPIFGVPLLRIWN
jgi:hypothetical protein